MDWHLLIIIPDLYWQFFPGWHHSQVLLEECEAASMVCSHWSLLLLLPLGRGRGIEGRRGCCPQFWDHRPLQHWPCDNPGKDRFEGMLLGLHGSHPLRLWCRTDQEEKTISFPWLVRCLPSFSLALPLMIIKGFLFPWWDFPGWLSNKRIHLQCRNMGSISV